MATPKKAAPKAAKKPAKEKAPKAAGEKTAAPIKKSKYAVVKKTDAHVILKKRSGRYGVRLANRQWLKGEEKTKVLAAEGLIKVPAKKKAAEAPAE